MNREAQSALAELVGRTGDVKRALERESIRLHEIERIASGLVAKLEADTPLRAIADEIRSIAGGEAREIAEAAKRLDTRGFHPALHALIDIDAHA